MIKEIIPTSLYPERRKHKIRPHRSNNLVVFKFKIFSSYKNLAHAVFSRHGGTSDTPYDTLNTSYSTEDRPECVQANLRVIQDYIGAGRLCYMNQVHGCSIRILKQGDSDSFREIADADAIITNLKNTGIMVKQADCQAVILFDQAKEVISNVHCGWRGNRDNILGAVVDQMKKEFGCKPLDIIAAIGPSLGPCCGEFVSYGKIFPEGFKKFMKRKNYFDLWAISKWQLMEAGLLEDNIETANICTMCRTDIFYSYRAEGVTGRFATVVMLK